jgi:hypothetical protein
MSCEITRRSFLTVSVGAAGLMTAGCSAGEQAGESKDQTARAGSEASGGMKLSLSVRVAEKFDNKKESSMTIDELIELAKSNGYAALCMRASQAGIQTPAETVQQTSGKIHNAGLAVSMVTGDFAIPQNDEHGPDALRNITPYLDLAEAFSTSSPKPSAVTCSCRWNTFIATIRLFALLFKPSAKAGWGPSAH